MYNGVYTADNAREAFVNNCFPVRQSMRVHNKNPSSSGAWMVVYRNKQKKELKAVLCKKSKTFEDIKKQREIAQIHGMRIQDVELEEEASPSTSARMQLGKTLSKGWLLKHFKIVGPTDIAVVRIESCDLARVDDRELHEFENVVHVKAADNVLPIDAFAKLPALETLEMQMNCIGSASNVTASLLGAESANFNLGYVYPNLRHLNLDYNDLGPADFDMLAYLPHLENISVIGNRLRSFPAPDYQRLEANMFFPSLLSLDVSENSLSADSDFLYLCGMPKLQQLIISANGIKGIPSIHFTGHRYAIVPNRHNFDGSPDLLNGDTSSSVLADVEDESARALSTIAETTSERSTPALLLLPPFPELVVADLSNNLIASDMALAGILSWPSLKQVILDGNPLAKRDEKVRRRANKASLKNGGAVKPNHVNTASSICEFLEQSLGINVVRSKTDLVHEEEPPKKPASSVLRRYGNLDAKIPKVPKCDVEQLLALCAPPPFETESLPSLPAVPTTILEESAQSPSFEGDQAKETRDNVGDASIQFFMTELAPEITSDQMKAECEKSLSMYVDDDKEKKKSKLSDPGSASRAVVVYDPRYQGFEELFTDDDANTSKEIETLELPTGLQESVHALRNMLDLPSVSRRPVAAIEAWANRQMMARRNLPSSTLQTMSAVGRVNDRPPIPYERYVPGNQLGPQVTRTYTQLVDGIISSQRQRDTIAEAPLGSVIHDGRSRNPRMYRSARRLLKQITGQYNDVRRNLDRLTASSARSLLNSGEEPGTS